MSETGEKPVRRKIWTLLLWTVLAGVLLLVGLGWYSTTDSFRELVRKRLVVMLEQMTGGRVELGSLHTVPFHFQFEVRNLTIHGREQPGEVPYAHVNSLTAQVKIWSILKTEAGLSYLVVDHPVIHIILYPDGSTNQPEPRVKQSEPSPPVERLFALSISRLEIRHGELIWGDERIPLDFAASNVSADMSYALFRRTYDGNILLGKVDTVLQNYRPFSWTAETHFTLSRNLILLKSLKATSGRSHLQAKGQISGFNRPDFSGSKIEADYDVTIDLSEAAALVRRPEVRRGEVRLTGHGAWSAQDFSSIGKVLVSSLDWRDLPMGLHNATLSAQYSVSPKRLLLTQIQGRVMGGSVSGDADVAQWLNPQTASAVAHTKETERQVGLVRLRLKDLSAAEIAAVVSTPSRPFHKVKLAGLVSGNVDARWRGSPRDAEIQVVSDVVPSPKPTHAQLPITAHIQGSYRAGPGELQLDQLNASTRATQVHASGTFSSSAALKVAVTTTDLSEWQPVFAAAGYSGPMPVTLKGHASFNGTATGKLSDITLAGNLQSQDFETLIPATSHTPEKIVTWDALRADIQLSPSVFAVRNATLNRNPDSLKFEFHVQLFSRQFTDASVFQAHLDTDDADVASMLALAGYSYPVTGAADVQLQVEGTRADPRGQGKVVVRNGSVYGEGIEQLSADLRFDGGEISATNILAKHQEATVSGDVAFNPASQGLRFNLKGTKFDLARIPQLQNAHIDVGGLGEISVSGSGTLPAPMINASIHVRDLTLDHERAGDFIISAVSRGQGLQVTGQSQFEQADLKIDGSIQPQEDWPADLYFHFRQLDVDSLLRVYMPNGVTGHSRADGVVHLTGALRRPRELELTASIDGLQAGVEEVTLHNDKPIRFSIAKQTLEIDQFHLVGDDTDLTATGTVQLTGDRNLDVRAQGRVNLKMIQSFNSDFTSSGVLTVNLALSGPFARPVTQGTVHVEHGAIAYIDLPSALSDINGTLAFNQDRLQIQSLTAHTGGGLVTFGGYATDRGGKLNFDLTVQGQDVRLRYPPGISSTANADLHFAGSPSGSLLSGDITVMKLAMTPGFDFGAYLDRSQGSALPPTNRLLNRVRLDVHIVTTPELQMQTSSVRLSGDADLRLRGSAAKPVILGRADIIEGEVYFNGTKYSLERGDVTFINPVTTTPVLDLQATTRIRDYDVTLNLNGQIDRPNVTYRSEPPLPTSDIIGLLAFGQTSQESAQLNQSQSAFNSETSSAILSAALNATVSNRVQKLFGVSRIKIDPQGLTTETSPTQTGPAVTIEQQVQNNLTLTYTTNVAQASQQIIQVEYNLTRNVSIVALRDQNGVVSFDVRVRRRKK